MPPEDLYSGLLELCWALFDFINGLRILPSNQRATLSTMFPSPFGTLSRDTAYDSSGKRQSSGVIPPPHVLGDIVSNSRLFASNMSN